MFTLIKRIFFTLVLLWAVSWALDLKFGGRPTQEWTADLWYSEPVQSVYQGAKTRVMAVLNKDISVEEVFQKDLPDKSNSPNAKPLLKGVEINMEELSQKDREKLKSILDKKSK